jgi:hypothetical protein
MDGRERRHWSEQLFNQYWKFACFLLFLKFIFFQRIMFDIYCSQYFDGHQNIQIKKLLFDQKIINRRILFCSIRKSKWWEHCSKCFHSMTNSETFEFKERSLMSFVKYHSKFFRSITFLPTFQFNGSRFQIKVNFWFLCVNWYVTWFDFLEDLVFSIFSFLLVANYFSSCIYKFFLTKIWISIDLFLVINNYKIWTDRCNLEIRNLVPFNFTHFCKEMKFMKKNNNLIFFICDIVRSLFFSLLMK